MQQYLSPGGQRGYNRRDTFQQVAISRVFKLGTIAPTENFIESIGRGKIETQGLALGQLAHERH